MNNNKLKYLRDERSEERLYFFLTSEARKTICSPRRAKRGAVIIFPDEERGRQFVLATSEARK